MEKNQKLKICRWRSFLFFLLSVYFLSGCSQHTGIDDDMDQRNAIGFSCTTDDAGTRVSETTKDNMEYFRVSAVWHRKDIFLMSNQFVEKVGNDWQYSPILYWPGQDKLSFFAYTPAISKGVSSYDIDKQSNTCTIHYAVENEKLEEQEDFMVATALNETGGKVALKFKHALSFVKFEARSKDGITAFQITRIKLLQLYNKGTLVGTPNPNDATTTVWEWNEESTLTDFDVNLKYSPTISSSVFEPIASTLAVLPQDLTNNNFKVVVEYTKIDGSVPKSDTYTPSLEEFVMGKRYTFNLELE